MSTEDGTKALLKRLGMEEDLGFYQYTGGDRSPFLLLDICKAQQDRIEELEEAVKSVRRATWR